MFYTIKISDLNKNEYLWLKKSYFYENLDITDTESEIYVPFCSIYSEDINLILEIINFWDIKEFPEHFYTLIRKEKPVQKLKDLYENTRDIKYNFFLFIATIREI